MNQLPPPYRGKTNHFKRLAPIARLLWLAPCLSVLISCSENTIKVPQEEMYLREFMKQFGTPAADHSWSVSDPIVASVSLASGVNGKVDIYTRSQFEQGSRLLATCPVVGGQADIRFDGVAGQTEVYARVTDNDGSCVMSAFIPVRDGRVLISDTSRASRASECGVTRTLVTDHKANRVKDEDYALLKEYFAKNPNAYMTESWDYLINNKKLGTQYDWGFQPLGSLNPEKIDVPNLYVLDNFDFSQMGREFSMSDIAPIVHKYTSTVTGEQEYGVFSELLSGDGKDSNIARYFHREKVLDPDVTMTVKENGPVTLDLMWRSKEGDNTYWGYYFYNDEQKKDITTDPLKFYNEVQKYIVFRGGVNDDANYKIDQKNDLYQIRYCSNKNNHSTVNNKNENDCVDGDHPLNDYWEQIEGDFARTIEHQYNFLEGAHLKGVSIKLVYFDKDGKATYDFPAGTHIGFLYGNWESPEKSFMSDSRLNQFINCSGSIYGGPDAQEPGMKDSSDWFVTAAKYRFNGSTYVGFEDGGCNGDLNDIIFRIHNTWPPERDITPEDLPKPVPQEWLVACEDLGSVTESDYDFNDVVLQISHAAGSEEVEILPLACGGTLDSYVYFNETPLGEIHGWLDVERGTPAGVGENSAPIDYSADKVAARRKTCTVASDWLLSDNMDAIKIKTQRRGENGVLLESTWVTESVEPNADGIRVPLMLMLPVDWNWPMERHSIRDAYPYFKTWVGEPTDAHDWVEYFMSEHIHFRTDR